VSRTILVVDDDRLMVKTLSAVLRLHGWTAVPAYTGLDAVRVCGTQRFDAVLMDVRMPGMNGVDALRAIRREQPLTPVLLMTAYAAHDLLDQAERDGAVSILPKPIQWNHLTPLLDELSGARRNVLLVDDDRAFLGTLSRVLEGHGRAVRQAASLAEALDWMEKESPSIVILDLKLDDLPPRDSVLAIKDMSPAVVLILYSGHPQILDETLAAVPTGSVHASLRKPFRPDQLIELLDAIARR